MLDARNDRSKRLGNPGCKFSETLQYTKRSERYHLPNAQQTHLGATVNPRAHGLNGNVDAGFPQPYESTVIAQKLTTALRAAIPGLTENLDVTSSTPDGAARFRFSIKPGNGTLPAPGGNVRSSRCKCVHLPFRRRKTQFDDPDRASGIRSCVEKTVWAPFSGVEFSATPIVDAQPGPQFTVNVRNEVMVASGPIVSPHFLELRGKRSKNS